MLHRIYDSWIKGAKPLCLFYNSEASSDLDLLQLLACVVPRVCDNQRQARECAFARVCVLCAMRQWWENQPAGLFEASVSFHFQKKNLAAANLILLLQGKRGSNQSERLKDRWTEWGGGSENILYQYSLFSNTELNKKYPTWSKCKGFRTFCRLILLFVTRMVKKGNAKLAKAQKVCYEWNCTFKLNPVDW